MYSETPDIIPFSSPYKMEVLSPSELHTLQNGTLNILSAVGVSFPSEKALGIFADHGADVNWNTKIVKNGCSQMPQRMKTEVFNISFFTQGRHDFFSVTIWPCYHLALFPTPVSMMEHVLDIRVSSLISILKDVMEFVHHRDISSH